MSVTKNSTPTEAESANYLRLQDFLSLCLDRKWWFLISVITCLALAFAYLLRTQPVYTRSSAVQVKESGQTDKSLASELSAVSGMGVFSSSSNVRNELVYFQSPDLIMEVVKRLGIDVSYTTDGTFHKQTLYGQTLPIIVAFRDLPYNDDASFTVTLNKEGKITLSNFMHNDEKCGDGKALTMNFGSEVKTPLGRLSISRADNYSHLIEGETNVYVKRTNLMSAVSAYKKKLSAELDDKQNDIIDLSFRDVNIQRAEDFLNMLVAVYNENWIKDKNQIAVSTSQFIG